MTPLMLQWPSVIETPDAGTLSVQFTGHARGSWLQRPNTKLGPNSRVLLLSGFDVYHKTSRIKHPAIRKCLLIKKSIITSVDKTEEFYSQGICSCLYMFKANTCCVMFTLKETNEIIILLNLDNSLLNFMSIISCYFLWITSC